MKQAYIAAEIFNGNEMFPASALLVDNSIITGIIPADIIPSDYTVLSYTDCLIAPSFIDLQLYGGNGKLFSHSLDIESLDETYKYCVAGGCQHFVITMATNTMEKFFKGIDAVREYIDSGRKGLLGIHLEGPWINAIKKGAHIEACIKIPTLKDAAEVIEKGRGTIKMITLAPEQCDPQVIRLLMDNDIIVSAGHSNANFEQASAAFKMGVPAATHLFNAMSPLQGREPGMVGAIYDASNVMASIICDGVHVDFHSVRISKKIMGERLFFITDAVTAFSKGNYQHVFKGDRYTLPNGILSGSCMTMLTTFQNAVQKVGITTEEALKMCSLYPARLIKHPTLGKILPGEKANFILINRKNYTLVQTASD